MKDNNNNKIEDKNSLSTDKTNVFERQSYVNEKEKSHKKSEFSLNTNENNTKKNEKDKLFEDMKNTSIKIVYDIVKNILDYQEIKIGDKNYNNINEINNNENPRDKNIIGFITFFEELEEKINKNYNKTVNFELALYIKGDKNKSAINLECLYKLIIKEITSKTPYTSYYKDFDIINNGPSEGLEQIIYDLNHHLD